MDPISYMMRLSYLAVSLFSTGATTHVAIQHQNSSLETVQPGQTTPTPVCKGLSWNWAAIDTNDLVFPRNFLFGVGTSAYQVEGGCTNNQYCEHECVTTDAKAQLRMPESSGDACDHWNRYKEDIQLIKGLGANAYRFSAEWSKIQPREDYFDPAALQHYVDVCDELIKNGIKPVITIHHYTDPIWFAHKGGFEKVENINYYVEYAAKLFEVLGDRVHLWLTFNSPVGYAMPGYGTGDKPPYKKKMQLAVEVLKNICEAHVQAYQRIKKMPGGGLSKVGILHNINQMDPISRFDPIAKIVQVMGDKLTNSSVFDFFRIGTFSVKLPFMVNVTHTNADAPQSLDFVGLNYYSHSGVKAWVRCPYPGEVLTHKKDHTLYAEGLFRALKTLSTELAEPLHIPIYVTENGIAPFQEEDRDLFLKRYIYAISQAIRDGVDVRGYFYWSLMDNYEWGTYEDRYGLYHVNFKTQQRTLKQSAQHYVDVARSFAVV